MKTRVLTLTTITLLALPSIAQERGQKRDQPERKKGELENVEKRIKSAVERGDITKEEAKAKFAEVKKMMEKKRSAEQKSDKPNFESIERRLKEGVKRGDLTEEQAKAKFAEMKKMMEKKRKHPEAVERAKKMRHELELKKREAANNKRNEQTDHQKRREHEEREQQERRKHEEREHHEHNHTERQLDEAREHAERQRERHHHARFDAIEKSLHQAVEAGLISGLEAQKTMAKIHLAAIKHQQKKERR
jgi:translation initiation factor IF-2